MLILHTSDWHLGRTLHHADLGPAYELWCSHVCDLVRDNGIDAVLISGDVYDRSVPSVDAVELFDATLAELAELTTVIVTSGNHDSPRRLGFGSRIMRRSVHFRTDSRDCGTPVPIYGKDGALGALVYPIPYLDPDVERRRLAPHEPGMDAASEDFLERSHAAVLSAALERVSQDIRYGEHAEATVARICMAHAFVTGGESSLSERDLHVGGVDCAPSGLFRLGESGPGPLSYVALGHLHSPQAVGGPGDPPMRYSGSPIAFSFSETHPKSSVLLHVDGTSVTPELIPSPVWRPVVTIEGNLAEILSAPNRHHAESFVRALVTDPDRPLDMSQKIRGAFPYALEILHTAESSAAHRSSLARAAAAVTNPRETVAEFFAHAGNRLLTPEEILIVDSVWEEALKQEHRIEDPQAVALSESGATS